MQKIKKAQHKWSKEEIAYITEITPGRSHKEIFKFIIH